MDLATVGDQLETSIPPKYAEDWDNVGWMVGPLSESFQGVLVTVDVTREALQSAIDRDLNLVLSHHPLIFESLDRVMEGRPVDDIVMEAVRQRVGIYTAHTNADSMPGGLNDLFADVLDLRNTEPLAPMEIDADAGLGRVGTLADPLALSEVENKIAEELQLTHLQGLGDPDEAVRTVAVCTGSGGDFISRELADRVDVYVTGDVGHHEAQEARALDLPVVILDHYEMETVFLPFARTLWRERIGGDHEVHTFEREYPYRHLR